MVNDFIDLNEFTLRSNFERVLAKMVIITMYLNMTHFDITNDTLHTSDHD